jgi:hypothetical protein
MNVLDRRYSTAARGAAIGAVLQFLHAQCPGRDPSRVDPNRVLWQGTVEELRLAVIDHATVPSVCPTDEDEMVALLRRHRPLLRSRRFRFRCQGRGAVGPAGIGPGSVLTVTPCPKDYVPAYQR